MNPDHPYIDPALQKAAADFVNGLLWREFKRALTARKPEEADTGDPTHVAAAKGHKRAGYEKCLEYFEKLPFEAPAEQKNPFQTPALYEKD